MEVHVEGRNQSSASRLQAHQKTTPEKSVPPSSVAESPNPKGTPPPYKDKTANSEVREVYKENFEEQLREIDREMGFLNENLDVLNVAENYSSSRGVDPCIITSVVNSPNNTNQAPLQDITNAPTTKVFKPGMGLWKKKARAKGNGPGALSLSLTEKRHSDAMLIDSNAEIANRPEKIQRVSPMEILPATAGLQPRLDQ